MRASNKAGFTIIETMLFLGITGLLVFGILAGTGSSINTQRYRDSISSLQSLLQKQYSNVASVSNGRNNNWTCDSTGAIVENVPGSGTLRGQSDCVILGRLITTSNDGQTLLLRDVVGNVPSVSAAQNDIILLGQYNIKLSPINSEEYDISWNSRLVKPGGNLAATFSILILQSPSSGTIRTFINPSVAVLDGEVESLIDQTALTQSAKMCVDSNGLFGGTKMAVVVNANSSGASGVETLGENSGC